MNPTIRWITVLELAFTLFFVSVPLVYAPLVYANGDHDTHEVGAGVGPEKAITDADHERGIRLSEKAMKSLGIRFERLSGPTPYRVPVEALVFYQGERGIYRHRQGWLKRIAVRMMAGSGSRTQTISADLVPGDEVVVEGVPLLRVAELEAWGASGDGHGH